MPVTYLIMHVKLVSRAVIKKQNRSVTQEKAVFVLAMCALDRTPPHCAAI
jgi:hypothetical protein